MKLLRLSILLLACLAVSQRLTFAAEPAWTHQGEQRYVLQRADDPIILGRVLVNWRHDGKRYELRSVTETAGVLAALNPARSVQESQGTLVPEGLQPLRFTHEKKRGTDSAEFDWTNASLSYRGQQVALLAGTQDLLSLYVQLAQRPVREGTRELPVAIGKSLATYQLVADGEERLTLGKHTLASVRMHAQLGDERMDFWVPAIAGGKTKKTAIGDLPWPLRVRVTDKNGLVLDQTLELDPGAR